jgi:HCOMODA/2-hydroxy-3-carboxy-muconic semialdehyde decarboxylase
MIVSETPQALVATANRILAREGVLDAFGHVSMRHPENPARFYLARSLAPELVAETDVLEFDLASQLVAPNPVALYSERVIHGAIYQARPDVNAICHHHAPAMLPFCLTDLRLRVVTQLGATIGKQVPLWDQREEFGATNHLVTRQEEAVSLARCLGAHAMVLMKRHGATVVASSLRELTFRSVYGCRDAELQLRALQYGPVDVFTEPEIELAGNFPEATLARAWGYWCARLVCDGATSSPRSGEAP